MATMSVQLVDAAAQRYSNSRYGEFAMIPAVIPPGPPPRVLAVPTWSTLVDTRLTRRPGPDATSYLDLVHEGTRWTYRLHIAYIAEPAPRGGFFQWPQPFEVGVLPD